MADPVTVAATAPWWGPAAVKGGMSALGVLGSVLLGEALREDPEMPEPPRPPVGMPSSGLNPGLGNISMASAPPVDLPEGSGERGGELAGGYRTSPVPQLSIPTGVSRGYERLLRSNMIGIG